MEWGHLSQIRNPQSNSILTLSWEATEIAGGDTYTVRRGTTSGVYTQTFTGIVNQYYTDTAVTNGVTYYYAVSRVNSILQESIAWERSATPKARTMSRRYAFITSATYQGRLHNSNALPVADTNCQTAANAGSLTSPLGRTWLAFMSTDTPAAVDARDRFAWGGPVLNVRGQIVFANMSDDDTVWPMPPDAAVRFDQNGNVATLEPWTGSTMWGTSAGGDNCDSFTNRMSGTGRTTSILSHTPLLENWIGASSTACNQARPLLCISSP